MRRAPPGVLGWRAVLPRSTRTYHLAQNRNTSARQPSLHYDPGATAGPRACAGEGTRRHKPDAFFFSQLLSTALSDASARDHARSRASLFAAADQ